MNAFAPLLNIGSCSRPFRTQGWARLVLLLVILPLGVSQAQLAITEVMSNAIQSPVGGDDYWELTNFGDEPVDLSPYWFKDDVGFSGAKSLVELWDTDRWGKPEIQPGESVMFVRIRNGLMSTPEDFRKWWGEDRISPELKIIFYAGYGFDNVRDGLNLWKVLGDVTNLVQRIELFKSPQGRSLSYDPATGNFGPFSYQGVGGAFLAATTEDVGSPGITSGRAPITILAFPRDTLADAGGSFTFQVRASGMPPPVIRWFFEGQPIDGAQGESYGLPAITLALAGRYSALLDNGLEQLMTPSATLTVNDQASCAQILRAPSDVGVTLYQTAIFHVETRGYPLPTFRWEFEGRELVGETSSTLRVQDVDDTRVGRYTVVVSNSLCSTNVSVHLTLEPTPQLEITEVMVIPANKHALQHDTWWELTNVGTNTVGLLGYHWNDNPAYLDGALTVSNDIRLAPGRSAIFVSGMSPDAFRRWWGTENLPADLAILSFNGSSLSTNGDLVKIWNATALTDDDWLVVSPTIIGAEVGRTLRFDPVLARKGASSVEGEHSAFRAAEGGDIGSPGWTDAFPRISRPRILHVQPAPDGVHISWRTEPGGRYELWRSGTLAEDAWTRAAGLTAVRESLEFLDVLPGDRRGRFYRVIRLP